jgi:hypothetical protein
MIKNLRAGHSWGCCLKLTFVVSLLIALLCASTPLVAQGTAPRMRVRVGPNVAVWPGGGPQSEPFIVAHPSKLGVFIIGTADWVAHKGLVPHAYATTDGGRKWIRASLPGLLDGLGPTDQIEGGGDPWIAFDTNGHAFFSVNFFVTGKGAPVLVYDSTDSGLTWKKTFALQPAAWDAPKILMVDTTEKPGILLILILNTGGKDHSVFGKPNRYATDIGIFRSDDPKKSLAPSALIAPGDDWYGTEHAVRLADGSVLVLFSGFRPEAGNNEQPRASYYVARSIDGGRTFGIPTLVGSVARQYPDMAWLAADTSHGRFAGRVYATWEAGDFGARSNVVNGVRVRVEAGTHRAVANSWSDDQGQTWSSPISLEAAHAGPCYMATVAVSSTGIVGILWVQHERYEQNPRCYRTYFAASIDGGRSFTKPVQVSESVSCPAPSVTETGFFQYRHRGGDYIGLAAAADGSFHAVWSDARDGIFRTFTARIDVDTAHLSL